MDGRGRSPSGSSNRTMPSVIETCQFAGTTYATPGRSSASRSTVCTGILLARPRISCRWLVRRGSRCWAITMGAVKSAGSVESTAESASIPPAEAPITTSCGIVSSTMSLRRLGNRGMPPATARRGARPRTRERIPSWEPVSTPRGEGDPAGPVRPRAPVARGPRPRRGTPSATVRDCSAARRFAAHQHAGARLVWSRLAREDISMLARDIIVVGASAGGVEALTRLGKALPADLPASLFVVLHLPPDAHSALPAILNRRGQLSAVHPRDGETIEQGRIYVAPPDRHVLLHRGTARVVRGPRENGHRPAVDPLFRSAAAAYGPRVIGIVLSGTLDDGTAGLLAIK